MVSPATRPVGNAQSRLADRLRGDNFVKFQPWRGAELPGRSIEIGRQLRRGRCAERCGHGPERLSRAPEIDLARGNQVRTTHNSRQLDLTNEAAAALLGL